MKSAKTFLMLLLLFAFTAVGAFAQQVSDPGIPLVYDLENTGSSFAAPVFPDFAHLPIIRPLPDPFVFFADGRRDTSFASWEQRRNEIKAAMEKYELGPKPDCADCTVTATWVPATSTQKRGLLTVTVTRTVNGSPVTITIPTTCYIPSGVGNGPFPAIMPMVSTSTNQNPSGTGFGTGSLGASTFTGLALASCDFPHNAVSSYGGPKLTDNFNKLYPDFCAGTANCTAANGFPNGSNSGQYAMWSWGVSRVIDGIIYASQLPSNPLPVDPHKLLVTGCSYAGKMALYAGAFDERIALTIAQENGGGGQPAWRTSTQIEADDVVENLDHTDHNWFASQMWQFQGANVYKHPIDHHELAAMVAPRALLETGNTDYFWLSNKSNTISSRATQQIYETLGIGDRYGFYIDGGHGHCSLPAAQAPVVASWTKKYLFDDATQNTDTHVTPFPTIDSDRWTAWWGTNNPTFPNDWNPGDGSVVLSSSTPNLPINPGDTLYAGYSLGMLPGHNAATVTVPSAYSATNVQTDVACPDGTFYTLTVPMPDASYSILDDAWYPTGDPASPLGYEASLVNTGDVCNNGVVTNTVFSALGKQATRGAGNAAGAGFPTSNIIDPLLVRYHYNVNTTDGAAATWSQAATVYPSRPQVIVTAKLTKNTNGTFAAALTFRNTGTGTAGNIRVTSDSLGGVAQTGNFPAPGDLMGGAIKNNTITFPATAGTSGNPSVLRIAGTFVRDGFTNGSFATSLRVVLP